MEDFILEFNGKHVTDEKAKAAWLSEPDHPGRLSRGIKKIS